jgi:hypothetical protein
MNFFQNFSKSPAICFELISFGYFIKSEIADIKAAALKPLSGQRAARPDSVAASDRTPNEPPSPRRPPRAAPTAFDRRLAPRAAAPTASPSPLSERRRRSPSAPVYPAVARRRSSPPVSRRPHPAISVRRRASPLPCSAAGRGRAGPAPRTRTVRLGRARIWPSAPG